jgi:PIN domain nuclease of toxin-antitoxin system
MKLLLDTHAFLWWLAGDERLSDEGRRRLRSMDTVPVLSAASSWEIVIKHRLGKLELPEDPESFVTSRMAREGISGLPIEHAHALAVADLPMHHKDPFDRILIAQAIVEGIPILTADSAFMEYDAELIQA